MKRATGNCVAAVAVRRESLGLVSAAGLNLDKLVPFQPILPEGVGFSAKDKPDVGFSAKECQGESTSLADVKRSCSTCRCSRPSFFTSRTGGKGGGFN